MKHYIYGLVDPFTHMISYIGQTNDLHNRWRQHVKNIGKTIKGDWMYKLRMAGVEPSLIILETTTPEQVDRREEYWISFGFTEGWPLTNSKIGNHLLIAENAISLKERLLTKIKIATENDAEAMRMILGEEDVSIALTDFVQQREFVSVSSLQKSLKVGYVQAKEILANLISQGLVSGEYVQGVGYRVDHSPTPFAWFTSTLTSGSALNCTEATDASGG